VHPLGRSPPVSKSPKSLRPPPMVERCLPAGGPPWPARRTATTRPRLARRRSPPGPVTPPTGR